MTMFRNRRVTWQAKRGTVRPRLSPLEVDRRTIRPVRDQGVAGRTSRLGYRSKGHVVGRTSVSIVSGSKTVRPTTRASRSTEHMKKSS